MAAVYDVTSRPFIENSNWFWPKNDHSDFNHFNCAFTNTNARRSFFSIHPDWLSEDVVPPEAEGRRHPPWLWEYPGARLDYETPREGYRRRIREQMASEDRIPRLHQDPHYQVKHSSPWYINSPAEVQDSNTLLKVTPVHIDPNHVRPWNNARSILRREVSLPPLLDRIRPSDGGSGDPTSREEVLKLRRMTNQYKTYCDW